MFGGQKKVFFMFTCPFFMYFLIKFNFGKQKLDKYIRSQSWKLCW